MSAADTYDELVRKIDDAKRRMNQAEGAYQQTLKRIKTEFGCASIKEAYSELKTLRSEQIELEEKFSDKVKQVSDRWESPVK